MQQLAMEIPSSQQPAADAPPNPGPSKPLAEALGATSKHGPGHIAPEYTKEDDEQIRVLFEDGASDEEIATALRSSGRPWQTALAVRQRRNKLLLYRQRPRSAAQRKRLAGKQAAETRKAKAAEALATPAKEPEAWILGQVGNLRFEVTKEAADSLLGWIDREARAGRARLRLDGATIKRMAGL